nr:ribonuclease H-like domain-containing protein [Tanacetum cinerariifolium]
EEEVVIDAISLAVKSLRIIDWKIHKEGKKSYYQIARADEKSQMYMIFSQILKSFDREDLEDLYKLVKTRYGSTRPVESMDYLLWSDMKTIFKPYVEDEIWKMQQGYKVLEWKIYDSYGVHSLMMQSMQIFMLVEKKYPLTPPTLSMTLEKKLQIDYESEMAYQLYADHAGCLDTRKSTSGGTQFLGGKLVCWSSNKQDCTTISIAEADFPTSSDVFPLPEEVPTARRKFPLPEEVPTGSAK